MYLQYFKKQPTEENTKDATETVSDKKGYCLLKRKRVEEH